MRLLLLEDDPILGEGLRDYLRASGHVVDWFARLADARAAVREPYDLLLIDWQLPDGSGVEWLRALRGQGVGTPALVLTARDQLSDRIHGLEQGADDYLVKPFDPQELLARMRAVLRRSGGQAGSGAPLALPGDARVDLSGRSAWRGSERVDLTAREWAVLEALLLRRGRLVSKADLERLVGGSEADIRTNTLEVHVFNLRRKLGRTCIQTLRGRGYRIG